ncbi:hypothetical protein VNI00_012764 [Paramarasmius palmivorus]|uniref:Major facilitator superfamily (MFS) profile domain-containing protein n=1 Tax=Paramarasmius palmivorus TaxID=297713 RepID=A0AAW0C2V5_9AGAR
MSDTAPVDCAPSYRRWRNNTHQNWWMDPGLRKNVGWVLLLYLGVFSSGYDGSLANGLQALSRWNEYFNHPSGARLGLIVASLYIPAVLVVPLIPSCLDTFGRKFTVSFGSFILIIGPLIASLAQNDAMLIAGRMLVGGSSFLTSVACICLINELLHPRIRGVCAALYTTSMQLGWIFGSWVIFGTLHWQSDWSWRLPLLLQAVGPGILFLISFFCPESPRWLVRSGKKDKAHEILAKYHANGDLTDELVESELLQIVVALDGKVEQSPWGALLSTPGNRRRTMLTFVLFTGPVFTGLGVVSAYLVPALRLVGIVNPATQVGIGGGFALVQALGCMVGGLLVDYFGRRPILLTSTSVMLVSFFIVTAIVATFSKSSSPSLGIAYVIFVYVFAFWANFGWISLSGLYVPEILPFSLRARGMALGAFIQALCASFSIFMIPIALDALAWKYYMIHIAVIGVYLVLVWRFVVETKGHTIEEIAELFDGVRLMRPSISGQEGAELKD